MSRWRARSVPAAPPVGEPADSRQIASSVAFHRRRAGGLTGIVVAAMAIVVYVAAWFCRGLLPTEFVQYATVAFWVLVPMCVVKALLAWRVARQPFGRWHLQLVSIDVAIDATLIVVTFAAMPVVLRAPAAALMAVPVLGAGVRLGAIGAFVTWLGVLFSYAGISAYSWLAGPPLSHQDAMLSALTLVTAADSGLAIAWIVGSQARSVSRHVRELESARAVLQHQATHDPLTGLANRKALYDQSGNWSGRGAFLGLDLDGFKLVNDVYGHAVGDELLRTVADRLRAAVGPDDLVVRMGGDEFVILLRGADAAAVEKVTAALAASIPELVDAAGSEVGVGASIGAVLVAAGGTWNIDALCAEADAKMYAAKAARKAQEREYF
jgi:diguanylate cyclase (GGDEF)-like protein